MSKPEGYLYMGIDIETGGPIITKHPLLAVGFCIYQCDTKGKSKKEYKLDFNDPSII